MKYLTDWINQQTPLLQKKHYTLLTKIYWILNGITEFPICDNINCNHKITRNVFNLTAGYTGSINGLIFCSKKCSATDSRVKALREETCLTNWGYTNVSFSPEIQTIISKVYKYDNRFFSSAQEIAYYIWLTDNNIKFEYQPKTKIIQYFTDDGKKHCYHPDFWIIDTNEIHEIKGSNNFNDVGYPIRNNKYDWHEKYQCMLDNNVVLLLDTSDIIKTALDYCQKKFNKKTWYRDFKYSKQSVV